MTSLPKHFVRVLFPLFLVLMALSLVHPTFCLGRNGEVFPAIENAENALEQAFLNVLDAEKAGANVSSLIVKLNEAGQLLAEAEIAYNSGDLDMAEGKAHACVAIANEVSADALKLKDSALQTAWASFMHTIIFSFSGAAAFAAVSILAWVWFKGFYLRKLLKMKPKVASDVEA